jgi:hypothetical protein
MRSVMAKPVSEHTLPMFRSMIGPYARRRLAVTLPLPPSPLVLGLALVLLPPAVVMGRRRSADREQGTGRLCGKAGNL